MWFKKKNANIEILPNEQYQQLLQKFTELYSEFRQLQIDFKVMQTDMENLRGNFNRKLRGIKKEDEEEIEKNKNPDVFLQTNGLTQ